MNAQPLPQVPSMEGGLCHQHPERPALGACSRCGTFYCADDNRLLNGKRYCEACASRPEVDYLEGFRLQFWGKRDGWAWLIGIGAVINLISGLLVIASGNSDVLLLGLHALASAVVGACFWLGIPWARLGLIFVPIVSMVVSTVTVGPAGVAQGVIPLIITIAIYNDTRNKLFFQEEVPREALEKAWHLYMNNRMARAGFLLGFLGLLIPGVAVIALVCSIAGLRRVNPDSQPPVGRKGQAIAGIVLGAIGTLGWGSVLLVTLLSNS